MNKHLQSPRKRVPWPVRRYTKMRLRLGLRLGPRWGVTAPTQAPYLQFRGAASQRRKIGKKSKRERRKIEIMEGKRRRGKRGKHQSCRNGL